MIARHLFGLVKVRDEDSKCRKLYVSFTWFLQTGAFSETSQVTGNITGATKKNLEVAFGGRKY